LPSTPLNSPSSIRRHLRCTLQYDAARDERLREEQKATDERLREEQKATDERLREEQRPQSGQ
jgi:hypothetical protein